MKLSSALILICSLFALTPALSSAFWWPIGDGRGSGSANAQNDAARFESISLAGMNAQENGVTLSGLSAGAFFAVQFHLAYPDIVDGSASIAGGAYWCSKGSANVATDQCMKGKVSAKTSRERYELEAQRGRVAPSKYLAGDRAFVFSGQNDILVARQTVRELETFFSDLIGAGNVEAIYDSPAGHGLPTLGYGKPCLSRNFFNSPWLLDCGLDGAGMMLSSLMPELHNPYERKDSPTHGKLYLFDQRPYIERAGSSLADFGHVYIPQTCQQGGCRIHVALHGCDQDPATVGSVFVTKSGYNEWADVNDLIILYPAAKKNYFAPQNPLGCFDWWGYSGEDFHVREGVQMKAVRKMIEALAR